MPDLPPIPSEGPKAVADGELILLPPARYLAIVNWINTARAVPGQCRAIISSERDHARISIRAAVARCEAAQRVAVVEANRQGVSPGLAIGMAVVALVLGVAAGALTVSVIK